MTRIRQTIARRLKEAQNTAAMLTTLPAMLLTRTVNCDPLSETAVNAVVYREEVAPTIGEPFLLHW